jgi:hypothetical protein
MSLQAAYVIGCENPSFSQANLYLECELFAVCSIGRVRTCFKAWKREEVTKVLEGNLLENEVAFAWLASY